MRPKRWGPDDTVTTRSPMCCSSRLVRAKCPRWLVPNCSSKPSAVLPCGTAMIPALLIRTSSAPDQPSAKARALSSDARSSARTSHVPGKAAATRSPLATSRTASTTCAPARVGSRAVTATRPLDAPVTTTVRPARSGRSADVHFEEEDMLGNVDAANKAVNDNNDGGVYSHQYAV